MTTERTLRRWIPALITALALAGFVSLSRAQSTIVLSNDVSESTAFYDGGSPNNAGGTVSNWWQNTGGPNGGGCIGYYIDGVIDQEIDPAFNVTFDTSQYYLVTVQLMVASSSGTEGNLGSGGYGFLQLSFRDTSYSWNGEGYETIYPPAANSWVTYSYAVPSVPNMAHLQIQLKGNAAYSGPVTVYIGDITIYPVPNPSVLSFFTNDVVSANWQNYGLNATWDSSQDAPYVNPVTGGAPVNVTPAGSVEFAAPTAETNYPGGQLNLPFNASQFQSIAFDLYYDGPTPSNSTNYGGYQFFIASDNAAENYPWVNIVSGNFNASMIGKWTHFAVGCASSGVTAANGLSFQATPGAGAWPGGTDGTVPITFHIDNIVLYNPTILPILNPPTPGTPGGVQLTLDADGNLNIYDQEGFSSPPTNNSATDFFWINQTPATYSFTLTNFPNPLAASSFDAHIYLWNGDSEAAYSEANQNGNLFGYNETYSGAPYNVPDYLGLRVLNGTNGGVVAMIEWKTNYPGQNAFTNISFQFPSMASANGTWTLNFTDNTHGSIVAADGSVNSFVLPDFANDPNYSANFTPVSSVVQFGIFKNGNTNNNSQTCTVTSVLVTNSLGTLLSDGFNGPGLTALYNWQVCTYYQDAATRAIWQPYGTAYWIKWNTTSSGWTAQSSSNLLNWANAGLSYTYPDGTGTNTLGAVPTTNLPVGSAAFFRLIK